MAETNQIACPNCGQTYAVRPEQWSQYIGRTINCTKCGKPFVVAAPPSAIQPPALPSTEPPAVQQGDVPTFASQAPLPYGGYEGQAATLGNAWAVTSLITGIVLFCVPVLGGGVALATGIVGLNRTKDPRIRGRGLAIAGIVLGGLSLLASVVIIPIQLSILIPSLTRAREQANRIKCASNMRQIGQALQMYANVNANAYPEKLEELFAADPSLSTAVLICPDDDKSPAAGNSPAAIAQQISTGQHSSYVYVGNGLTVTEPADSVLLYEPMADHRQEGMNVLYADGHVTWLPKVQAKSILNQQSHGVHPIKDGG